MGKNKVRAFDEFCNTLTENLLQHVVAYAISRSLINVAAFISDISKEGTPCGEITAPGPAVKEELLTAFTGWEPEVRVLLHVRIIIWR